MLKIELGRTTSHLILRAEGDVVGPWVEELEAACERALAAADSPVLDLAGVAFVDRAGVRLLAQLMQRGVVVVHCPGFVTEQLRSPSPC